MEFTNENITEDQLEKAKKELEEIIISENDDAIINPYAANLKTNVSDVIDKYGAPIISRIIEE